MTVGSTKLRSGIQEAFGEQTVFVEFVSLNYQATVLKIK